ncbi:MAG: AAA family ATPase [Thermomicrobiales bacterium]|nr:AAA family ATPase [Thermomicrobiales bacterium]
MSLPSSATLRTSFVGRDAELASLRSLILRPATRLVTVTGVGGVGKTRLVNELHSHLDGQFAGGIWFVPVAHVREPEQVLAAVATRVGIRDLDADETIRRVVERFDGQPSLLMLDNLEQVIECGTIIARLLHAAPALTILATSRQPLHLLGEVEFPVRPLPVKASADSEPPAETLFIARARESSYRFVVTDDNRKAIASITQRLGGLPLAIELAASWVKVLPPQRLLENLDRQLDVLVRGRRDLPERQQTMRSAIAWSYSRHLPNQSGHCFGSSASLRGLLRSVMSSALPPCR